MLISQLEKELKHLRERYGDMQVGYVNKDEPNWMLRPIGNNLINSVHYMKNVDTNNNVKDS